MRLIADLHTHTLASTHAFSTILENAREAADQGLLWLGWTDHAPPMTDAPHLWHFQNLSIVPERLFGVRILKGIEADISKGDGSLDVSEDLLKKMEWVVASIHSCCYPSATLEEHTQAYVGAAANPHVDVIGHSGLVNYPYDYEKAVRAFKEYGKLVELNEGTFRSRSKSIPNCVEIAKLCKKYECQVVLNSDAHFAYRIGRLESVQQLLADIDFPERLVVNSSPERMEDYLQRRKRRLEQFE